MDQDSFKNLFIRLKSSEEAAWDMIITHIGIILPGWAKEAKIEIDWIASGKQVEDSEVLIRDIYLRLRSKIENENLILSDYSEYREQIIGIAYELLDIRFRSFYNLLVNRNNIPWKIVSERLYIYSAKWFSDRKIGGESSKDIFYESISLFFEKLYAKSPDFGNSREMKSYFFRILELKALEFNRKKNKRQKRYKEMDIESSAFVLTENKIFEADDKYFYLSEIIKSRIPDEEQYILRQYYFYNEKLSDIAKHLNISDGNCRLKKYNAIRSIKEIYEKDYSLLAKKKVNNL